MESFRLIALTPSGLDDPAIAIAACRAGEIGILDLGHSRNTGSAMEAVGKLARLAKRSSGVRLSDVNPDLLAIVVEGLPEAIDIVVLSADDPERLAKTIRGLKSRGRQVMLEVTDSRQTRAGAEIGVDGFIVKGHESGGWVGEETAFVLLQRLLSEPAWSGLPVWVRGGIGLHTAAAGAAAGAAGVVLDSQLLATRESSVGDTVQRAVKAMDGSETTAVGGGDIGASFRLYSRSGGGRGVDELSLLAAEIEQAGGSREEMRARFRRAVEARVGWGAGEIWPLGQDAAFAESLARKYVTVAGVLQATRESIDGHLRAAIDLAPLGSESPLARSHRTRYPVVQGPMTRVSDRAEFALRVAEGGGLPFLALALMRAPEVEQLLKETSERLGDRSWGVGILGFVPLQLRQEQLEVIRKYRPPFALIAGGRPDQARGLSADGTATYLHVPSPGLLELFLKDGARRFVFEGKECGGHVGPRSSFVLWNSMIDKLLDSVPASDSGDCHVLFAGGIHDAVSASMVAAMAAPLAERGMKVGVLLGTAYLFTEEAVESGAIVRGFQEVAIRCDRTVTLETGPGHSTRCAETPFARSFQEEKRKLLRDGRSSEEIRDALEMLNIGRLRVASKGIDRNGSPGDPAASLDAPHKDDKKFVEVQAEEQRERGMYMIGQVAALRSRTCLVAELHREVSLGATERIEALRGASHVEVRAEPEERPSAVAIVGMSCILPKAPDLQHYWDNILAKVDAITEIPKERWDWELYFDADPRAKDKIYSRWGGFLDDQTFDPVEFGMPPNSLKSVDPMQLLALKAARLAIEDAGYGERPFDRSRTSVILGASGGTGDLGAGYLLRSSLPLVVGPQAASLIERSNGLLPEWTEDSFAGLLLNVAAGRIANRFDFGGVNYVVDAACASSLAAVHQAVRELETGSSDMVLVGGVDTTQNPFGYLCFSKTRALSPTGHARTFDAEADGIAISEGIGMLVLKRLEDAERDGDRIYAVIRGTGGSSDGRAKGMTAPRPEGQVAALRRAYRKAGISPTTVGLFEAHGTGTVVGDRAEALALTTVLDEAGAGPKSAAVGSVKSMIGHTKATAGIASIVKVALALHQKVLPPTLGVTSPSPGARLDDGPLYVNTETRPWVQVPEHPRRAGVSSFGFGGTNFHAVLEEYTADVAPSRAMSRRWPTEIVLIAGRSRDEIAARIDRVLSSARQPEASLLALAYGAWTDSEKAERESGELLRLAIVAGSVSDLTAKLGAARKGIEGDAVHDARGIYFSARPHRNGLAFLFPGQGSQYPNMLRDLAVHFPEVRERFEAADRAVEGSFEEPLSRFVFPPPAFGQDQTLLQQKSLTRTHVAQPALGAADTALASLLGGLGVAPDMVAGHSYGEYVALYAAGVFDFDALCRLSVARGRSIVEAASADLGTMAAADASASEVDAVVESLPDVWLSNFNSPRQTILSGSREGIEAAIERLSAAGIRARVLPVACAFHSPIVAPARKKLAEYLAGVDLLSPRKPVYSNVTAGPYPERPESIREILADHLEKPVLFADQVRAMYDAGARLFVEVGPRNVLTGLSDQILEGLPHTAVAMDVPGRSGLTQLQHGLGILAAEGVPVNLHRLFAGRIGVMEESRNAKEEASPTTWIVNGSRARRLSEPHERAAMPSVSVSFPEPGAAPSPPAPAKPSAPSLPAISAAAPPSARAPRDASSQAMLEFQNVMNRFLETQRSVMSAYLRGSAQPAVSGEEMRVSEAEPAVEATPVPPPAVPAVPPVPVVVAEVEVVSGRETLEAQLLAIVSERTGYPADMLGLDVDIEAELGIDSIKRVEILGTVQRTCLPENALREDAMEQLNGIKTLRGIVDWLEAAVNNARGSSAVAEPAPGPSPSMSQAAAATPEGEKPEGARISRATLHLVDRPLAQSGPARWKTGEGALLVTEDSFGVARAFVDLVRERGGRAVLLRPRPSETANSHEGPSYEIDPTDPAGVDAMLKTVREREGSLCGLVHLAPWSAGSSALSDDFASWRRRLAGDVKGFFYAARSIARDLERQAAAGRPAWCVACMPTSGGEAPRLRFPGHAALRGMAKTLALEWSGVRCASIEIASADPAHVVARRILEELASGDGLAEVVYQGTRRMARSPKLAALPDREKPEIELGSDSVIVLTGGGRGITAEVAVDLAKRYRPTLLLWGRIPEPPPEESAATRALSSPQELKAALIAEAESRSEAATLPVLESRYQHLLKEREVRRTIERVGAAGGRALYRAVDIRSEGEVDAALAWALSELGRVDVVVHGAGVIEDKLVAQKSPESFDRVFDTKVDGAFLLSKRLPQAGVKALALFASAAGTFGNRGQCDYAGANEVLGELAESLNREWPGRVFSISWGPWEKTGMVSAELRREFEKRGVALIPVDEGCRRFDAELRAGNAKDAQVVIGGGAWSASKDAELSFVKPSAKLWLPLVRDSVFSNGGSVVRARRWLDPSKDLYLTDHRIDGVEVLPMAVASEFMAEVVQQAWPELQVVGVRDLQLLHGVVLEGGPREVSVVARPQVEPSYERPGGGPGVDVHVELRDAEGGGKPYYRATVELSDRPPGAPRFEVDGLSSLPPFEAGVEQAYRQWLFHGPLLQGITRIEGLGARGVAATLQPSPPGRCLKGVTSGEWLIDPVVFDSGLQLFLLWARANVDKTPLPSRFTRLRRYAPIGSEPVRCYLRVLEKSRDPVFYIDVHFVGADGRLLWSLEEMEGVCTRALNRLGGSWLVHEPGLEVAGKSTGPV